MPGVWSILVDRVNWIEFSDATRDWSEGFPLVVRAILSTSQRTDESFANAHNAPVGRVLGSESTANKFFAVLIAGT